MTYFPMYIKDYPNMGSSLPLYLSRNKLANGFPAHRHDFLEFSYVVEGSGAESINGVLHPMKPGTFTFVLPYQVHELHTDAGSELVLYNCCFSMDLLAGAGANGELWELLSDSEHLTAHTYFDGDEQDELAASLGHMYSEFQGHDRWRRTMLQAKLKELLVRFDRKRRADGQQAPRTRCVDSSVPSEPPAFSVWPLIHYIQTHYQEELSLALLAKQYALSPSRISELIKQTTGQTFVQFVHDLRLRHASGLLVSTEMSVSEIAYEVGFGSYKTFSRLFREYKGALPSEFRKHKKAQSDSS
ncbi:AraC family transcriptional regulator [Paenibacillus sp. YYML68]|uniref:AraC family transcriptional regulator n=1 Tax=Paenibacillus sp. YYML68 TaxID=2909250 RepID=UPI0024931306|nr:AraC family transcriptional regulator [Paenibacillus sp. YYML68]